MAPDAVQPAPDDSDALDEVARVLATHVDEDGHCRGCIIERARLVPFPCRQGLSARLAIDRPDDPGAGLPGRNHDIQGVLREASEQVLGCCAPAGRR